MGDTSNAGNGWYICDGIWAGYDTPGPSAPWRAS
jgi:hypothetical protein